MVVHTQTFCLPAFEGSDSPCLNTGTVCEPSTIWCDFAAGVETQLTAFDSILGRTALALPIAFVSYQPNIAVAVSDAIPFDVVNIDTDQMVDLDVFSGIMPRRNGVYLIDAMVRYTTAANDARLQARIKIGNEVMPFLGAGPDRVATAIARGAAAIDDVNIRASVTWKFDDTTPTPRAISVINGFTSPVSYASLSAYWHSEV